MITTVTQDNLINVNFYSPLPISSHLGNHFIDVFLYQSSIHTRFFFHDADLSALHLVSFAIEDVDKVRISHCENPSSINYPVEASSVHNTQQLLVRLAVPESLSLPTRLCASYPNEKARLVLLAVPTSVTQP